MSASAGEKREWLWGQMPESREIKKLDLGENSSEAGGGVGVGGGRRAAEAGLCWVHRACGCFGSLSL